MCIEDERVNVQDVFFLWLLWSVDTFFQDKCWSEVPTRKGLKYPSEYTVLPPSGRTLHDLLAPWETSPRVLLEAVWCSGSWHCILWKAYSSNMRVSAPALVSISRWRWKTSTKPGSWKCCHPPGRVDICTFSCLLYINNEWFPSTHLIGLFRPI